MNPVEQAEAYLRVLVADADPDAYVELRGPAVGRGRWASEFHPVGGLGFACADRIVDLGSSGFDVYVGVLPRIRKAGGADAIDVGRFLWIDLDSAAAVKAMGALGLSPTMIVRSGGRDGNVANQHVYVALREPVEGAQIEVVNRQLATRLGADLNACDCARILRPAGTFNCKRGGRSPVEIAELHPDRRYLIDEIEEIVGRAPAEPADRANVVALDARPRPGDDPATAYLRRRSAPEYVEIVTGVKVGVGEKISCPAPDHPDPGPSCHIYADGWRCYGCGRGGGIFEFGALVAGLLGDPNPPQGGQQKVRGRDFLAIKDVLLARYERAKGVAS